MEDQNAQVIKKGETCIRVRLRRSVGGLSIQVQAHREVEALFKAWGDGNPTDVNNYVRKGWVPIGGVPILIYPMRSAQGPLIGDNNQRYSLDHPGSPLKLQDPASGQPDRMLNMSFLRIAGISDGAGVGFTITGVWTLEAIRLLREEIENSARRFYNSYLRPVDTSLMIFTSVQEVPGSGWVGGRVE